MKMVSEINPKTFEIGQVAYYHKPLNVLTKNRLDVLGWGIVEEIYHDGYCLANYELIDGRTIDGILFKDYNFNNEKRKKLPKGWTYNTKLINEGFDENIKKMMESEPFNYEPDTLKHLIDVGLFVKPSSQYRDYHAETDINKDGYIIVRKKSSSFFQGHNFDHVFLGFNEIYHSYKEVNDVVDGYLQELKRQAELSDRDWSIDQIDKTLNRWAKIYNKEDLKEKVREELLSLDEVEDVEVRIYMGDIQWKYTKNKRWMNFNI